MSCFFPLFCLYRRYVPFIFAADFPYRTQTGNLPRFYFITFLRFPLKYSWNKHNDDSSGRFWVVIRPCYARWFIFQKKKNRSLYGVACCGSIYCFARRLWSRFPGAVFHIQPLLFRFLDHPPLFRPLTVACSRRIVVECGTCGTRKVDAEGLGLCPVFSQLECQSGQQRQRGRNQKQRRTDGREEYELQ